MGNYEQTEERILLSAIRDSRARKVIKNGEDGFEYRTDCSACEFFARGDSSYLCLNRDNFGNIRKVNGGEICNLTEESHKGRCYRFVSFDDFWDFECDDFIINPETGEVTFI